MRFPLFIFFSLFFLSFASPLSLSLAPPPSPALPSLPLSAFDAQSRAAVVYLCNPGALPLTLLSAETSGAHADAFEVALPAPVLLPPRSHVAVRVQMSREVAADDAMELHSLEVVRDPPLAESDRLSSGDAGMDSVAEVHLATSDGGFSFRISALSLEAPATDKSVHFEAGGALWYVVGVVLGVVVLSGLVVGFVARRRDDEVKVEYWSDSEEVSVVTVKDSHGARKIHEEEDDPNKEDDQAKEEERHFKEKRQKSSSKKGKRKSRKSGGSALALRAMPAPLEGEVKSKDAEHHHLESMASARDASGMDNASNEDNNTDSNRSTSELEGEDGEIGFVMVEEEVEEERSESPQSVSPGGSPVESPMPSPSQSPMESLALDVSLAPPLFNEPASKKNAKNAPPPPPPGFNSTPMSRSNSHNKKKKKSPNASYPILTKPATIPKPSYSAIHPISQTTTPTTSNNNTSSNISNSKPMKHNNTNNNSKSAKLNASNNMNHPVTSASSAANANLASGNTRSSSVFVSNIPFAYPASHVPSRSHLPARRRAIPTPSFEPLTLPPIINDFEILRKSELEGLRSDTVSPVVRGIAALHTEEDEVSVAAECGFGVIGSSASEREDDELGGWENEVHGRKRSSSATKMYSLF